jgi:hypothetical protein
LKKKGFVMTTDKEANAAASPWATEKPTTLETYKNDKDGSPFL